jgi:hypothetical protein
VQIDSKITTKQESGLFCKFCDVIDEWEGSTSCSWPGNTRHTVSPPKSRKHSDPIRQKIFFLSLSIPLQVLVQCQCHPLALLTHRLHSFNRKEMATVGGGGSVKGAGETLQHHN